MIRGGVAALSREASRVAERVNIRDIRLLGSSSELKSLGAVGPFQWDLSVSPSVEYEEGDLFFVLIIGYQVAIEQPGDSNAEESDEEEDSDSRPEEVADISFQFGVLCELERESFNSEITREEVEEYADAAARIVLTPYVREYLHDVTMRMGLPPLVMDILPSFAEEIPEHANADGSKRDASLAQTCRVRDFTAPA